MHVGGDSQWGWAHVPPWVPLQQSEAALGLADPLAPCDLPGVSQHPWGWPYRASPSLHGLQLGELAWTPAGGWPPQPREQLETGAQDEARVIFMKHVCCGFQVPMEIETP